MNDKTVGGALGAGINFGPGEILGIILMPVVELSPSDLTTTFRLEEYG